MAIIAGIIIDHFRKRWIQLLGMIIGTAVCYVFGTAWFLHAGRIYSICNAENVIPSGSLVKIGHCLTKLDPVPSRTETAIR